MEDLTGDLDLAPIGNCAVSALIDRLGRYVWACVPRFDSDPVFSSLLSDRDPGDSATRPPQSAVGASRIRMFGAPASGRMMRMKAAGR